MPVYIRILLHIRICSTLLVELVRSLVSSTLDPWICCGRESAASPLIAAVVVVFVTSDAWKIFGSGLRLDSVRLSFCFCWPVAVSWSIGTLGGISVRRRLRRCCCWQVSITRIR